MQSQRRDQLYQLQMNNHKSLVIPPLASSSYLLLLPSSRGLIILYSYPNDPFPKKSEVIFLKSSMTFTIKSNTLTGTLWFSPLLPILANLSLLHSTCLSHTPSSHWQFSESAKFFRHLLFVHIVYFYPRTTLTFLSLFVLLLWPLNSTQPSSLPGGILSSLSLGSSITFLQPSIA